MLHTKEQFEASGRRVIQDGDLVVVYERFDSMKAVRVTQKGSFGNKYGNFLFKDWIGQPYGSRMYARAPSKGWVYVLAPTPELWTTVLRHRTQILYVADISLAITLMELAPGSTVIESGTGSGSMTTSLARAVAPSGRVHTFEFHEQRAKLAAQEFEENGLAGVVSTEHRDVEASGFPEALHGQADGLFLDLPAPWRVVPSAAACLRPNGVFCSFSPCIEQVQRTCKELNAQGFRDLRTVEILLRQHEVVREQQATDIDVLLQQAAVPANRGAKRQRQADAGGAAATEMCGALQQDGTAAAGNAELQQQEVAGNGTSSMEGVQQQPATAGKPEAAAPEAAAPEASGASAAVNGSNFQAAAAAAPQPGRQQQQQQQKQVLCRPVQEGRGHTGYLTFARKAVAL